MLCPYCQNEHAEDAHVCPSTGLPLWPRVVCLTCGQVARPSARYCAGCGATLPRAQSPVQEEPEISEGRISDAIKAGSQSFTRPSVSLVELSRRKTRASQSAIPTSPRAIQQWAQQHRVWQVIGYALLLLVLLAGAAGLYLIWYEIQ